MAQCHFVLVNTIFQNAYPRRSDLPASLCYQQFSIPVRVAEQFLP